MRLRAFAALGNFFLLALGSHTVTRVCRDVAELELCVQDFDADFSNATWQCQLSAGYTYSTHNTLKISSSTGWLQLVSVDGAATLDGGSNHTILHLDGAKVRTVHVAPQHWTSRAHLNGALCMQVHLHNTSLIRGSNQKANDTQVWAMHRTHGHNDCVHDTTVCAHARNADWRRHPDGEHGAA